MANALQQFVPPIVWSATKRVLKPSADKSAGKPAAAAMDMAKSGSYTVRYKTTSHAGNTYFVPSYAAHRPAARAALQGEFYEPQTHEIIALILGRRPGSMVHAGTFFGDMVPSFAKACSATLYAFEPVLENYVLAKLCVEANSLDNVVLINAGLGSAITPAKIDTGSDGTVHKGGGSTIAETGQATCIVTIDAFGIADLSVLQLDVEGHELPALQGAEQTLDKTSPIVLIEDNLDNCADFLKSKDYLQAGSIPGLSIWAREPDIGMMKEILDSL